MNNTESKHNQNENLNQQRQDGRQLQLCQELVEEIQYRKHRQDKQRHEEKFQLFSILIACLFLISMGLIIGWSTKFKMRQIKLGRSFRQELQSLGCQQIIAINNSSSVSLQMMDQWLKSNHSSQEVQAEQIKSIGKCGILRDSDFKIEHLGFFGLRFLIVETQDKSARQKQIIEQVQQRNLSYIGVSTEIVPPNAYIILKFSRKSNITLNEENVLNKHFFIPSLSKKLVQFYTRQKVTSILDLGCGLCNYLKILKDKGFDVSGYDVNPSTQKLTGGNAKVANLTQKQDFKRQFDWVQSLQVGQHIPKDKTNIFVQNIANHAKKGIIISWAVIGQNGPGHINNKNNNEVVELFKKYGFRLDQKTTAQFRELPQMIEFKKSFMVLIKNESTQSANQTNKNNSQAVLDSAFRADLQDLGCKQIIVVGNASSVSLQTMDQWLKSNHSSQEVQAQQIKSVGKCGLLKDSDFKVEHLRFFGFEFIILQTQDDFALQKRIFQQIQKRNLTYIEVSTEIVLPNIYVVLRFSPQLQINHKGYWTGSGGKIQVKHAFVPPLANKLVQFYTRQKVKSVLDLGCGLCDYVKILKEKNFDVQGYDGNPFTQKLTNNNAKVADLTEKQDFKRQFDWVQSFQVGEHIPKDKTDIFIHNIASHAKKGIVISWAVIRQTGNGHINNKKSEDVMELFKKYGFQLDRKVTYQFRNLRHMRWFKYSLLVLRKNESIEAANKIAPVKQPLKQPAKQAVQLLLKQPTKQPIKQVAKITAKQPTKQPINQPVKQLTKQSIKQPVKQLLKQPQKQPLKQTALSSPKQPPISPPKQPVIQPTKQPSKQATKQPVISQPIKLVIQAPKQTVMSPSKQPVILMPKQQVIQVPKQPVLSPPKQPLLQASKQPVIQPPKQPTNSTNNQPTKQAIKNPTLRERLQGLGCQQIIAINNSSSVSLQTMDQWLKSNHSSQEVQAEQIKSIGKCGILRDSDFKIEHLDFFGLRFLIVETQDKSVRQKQIIEQVQQRNLSYIGVSSEIVPPSAYIVLKFSGQSEAAAYQGSVYFATLANKLLEFYTRQKASSILGLGCGLCSHLKILKERGLDVVGYDADSAKITNLIQKQDLGRQFDWVQSFEVGEHIPRDKTDIFVQNIASHAKKGIVVSWAVVGQNGPGHINNKNNEDVVELFRKYGFRLDQQMTTELRNVPEIRWFKYSLLVLRKTDINATVNKIVAVNQPAKQLIKPTKIQKHKQQTKQSNKQPPKQSAKVVIQQPIKQPSKQPVKQSVIQVSKQSVSSSSKQPVIQATKKPVIQPPKQPIKQAPKQPIIQTIEQPVISPPKQPVLSRSKPVIQPPKQPIKQVAKQPTNSTNNQPTKQAIINPTLRERLQSLGCQQIIAINNSSSVSLQTMDQWLKSNHSSQEVQAEQIKSIGKCGILRDSDFKIEYLGFFGLRFLIVETQDKSAKQKQIIEQVQKRNLSYIGVSSEIVPPNAYIILKFSGQSEAAAYQGSVYFATLANKLLEFYTRQKASSILGLGCGLCSHLKILKERGLDVVGYDADSAKIANLIQKQDLGRQFDWVQSFEVGEHIPRDKTDIFVQNIASHAKKGIVVSWAVVGQNGPGHINNKNNEDVVELFRKYGFRLDQQTTTELRNVPEIRWFKYSLLVLRR